MCSCIQKRKKKVNCREPECPLSSDSTCLLDPLNLYELVYLTVFIFLVATPSMTISVPSPTKKYEIGVSYGLDLTSFEIQIWHLFTCLFLRCVSSCLFFSLSFPRTGMYRCSFSCRQQTPLVAGCWPVLTTHSSPCDSCLT